MRARTAFAMLLLAGCNDAGQADVTRILTGGLLTDRMLGIGQPTEPDRMAIAAAESDEEDEGVQNVRLALGRREATASLIQEQGQRRLWRAPGGVVVATDGARVVATSGLPQMVTATRFDGPDPLEDPKALIGRSVEARRLVDIMGAARDPASMRFGLSFDCRLRGFRTEEAHTILVEERCRVPGFSAISNRFWADERTNRVGFAQQWVGPGISPLSLDFDDEDEDEAPTPIAAAPAAPADPAPAAAPPSPPAPPASARGRRADR